MKKNHASRAEDWLEQAYPQMHYMLLALEGDGAALGWLDGNSKGVGDLTRAMNGDKRALAALNAETPTDLDDLFEVIDNEDLSNWLKERQPEVHLLFEAIKGDDGATTQLKRKKPNRAKVAELVRQLHEQYLQKTNGAGEVPLDGAAAADIACLTSELHLQKGDYEKAIEAFNRAIETQPAPDLYEGRARAYRGLAERDEARARELRRKG